MTSPALHLPRLRGPSRGPLLVAALVLAASLLGIVARPVDFLSALWPANALLLGLLLRRPGLATPSTWLAAVAAYLAADLLTGSFLFKAVWLTAANIAGVACGVVAGRMLMQHAADRQLRRPQAVLKLLLVCAAAALGAAVVGSGTGPALFDMPWLNAWWLWLCSEAVTYLFVLPVMLVPPMRAAVPRHQRRMRDKWPWRLLSPMQGRAERGATWATLQPLLALAASVAAMFAIGGPGAITFPVPALMWCALAYQPLVSVVLTLGVCAADMLALHLAVDSTPPYLPQYLPQIVSQRIGVALLSLAPLMVGAATAVRNDLEDALRRASEHDALTQALSRAAFLAHGQHLLLQLQSNQAPVGVLMLDIDHFKRINDTHGHAAGDAALQAFSRAARATLRDTDLLGRLGGEEFAVLLPDMAEQALARLAERLRRNVANLQVPVPGGAPLRMTVTIGATWSSRPAQPGLPALLAAADRALYQGKTGGRNQVVRAETLYL